MSQDYIPLGGGGGGFVSGIIGTANQVLANGTSGSVQTGNVTVALGNPLQPPGQIQGIDGTNAAPSYSFANHPSFGMSYTSSTGGGLAFSIGNFEAFRIASEIFFFENANLTALTYGLGFQTFSTGTSGVNPNSTIYCSCDPSGGAITLDFPSNPSQGQIFIVKDATGSAGTNHITITTTGGTITFDGATSLTISTNYGVSRLIWNGTNYNTW